jgi:hypothetical protein
VCARACVRACARARLCVCVCVFALANIQFLSYVLFFAVYCLEIGFGVDSSGLG